MMAADFCAFCGVSAVLDYLSDFICCLYGQPGAYGVVTLPFSVREGINIFLAGVEFVCCVVCFFGVCVCLFVLLTTTTNI